MFSPSNIDSPQKQFFRVIIIIIYITTNNIIIIIAAFTDCYDAAVDIFTNFEKYGIDPDRIVLSGDSAGGQLSLSVGLHLAQKGYALKGRDVR